MFAPILPSPTIASCMNLPPAYETVVHYECLEKRGQTQGSVGLFRPFRKPVETAREQLGQATAL
jgi:DNA topoisomerase IB